jgi:hypothetical protein
MTALAEALLTAQRNAVTALGKWYVSGPHDEEKDVADVEEALNAMGCTDKVEQAQLIAAWDVLRARGSEPPTRQDGKPPRENEPASEAQMRLIKKLADERRTVAPDYQLTKQSAHEAIDQLKAGTYNPDDWQVPF